MYKFFFIILLVMTIPSFADNLSGKEFAAKAYEYWQTGDYNKYDEAIEYFKRALEKEPENAEYYGSLGRVLFDMGKLDDAKFELEKSINFKPSEKWVIAWDHIILGRIYDLRGDYKNAPEHFKIGASLKATKNSRKEAEGRIVFCTKWKNTSSEHFLFRYPPVGYSEKHINEIISKFEKSFSNITSFLGVKMPGKIIYYLFPSRKEAMDIIGYEPGFSVPPTLEVYALYSEKERQTTGHEMTHVISFYMGNTINSETLIREGLAEFLNQEGEDFHGETAYLKKTGQYISLKDLRKNFRSYDTQIAYNESASFVKFLVDKKGMSSFKKVWVREDFEHALKEVYGKTYDELGIEWEAIIGKTPPVEWSSGVDIMKELEEDLKELNRPGFPFN